MDRQGECHSTHPAFSFATLQLYMKSKPTRTVPPDSYLPAADFLLLDVAKEEEVQGGIIIPEQARKFLHEGEILKVGPQVSPHFQKGMFVVFSPASEFRLEIEKDVFVTAVAEPNIILYRDPLQPLFPIPAAVKGNADLLIDRRESKPIRGLEDLPPRNQNPHCGPC